MGLTSALYTGMSGLNANQARIDVIGDNIANVNTTGFKGSRSLFQTQFAQSFTLGSPPGDFEGGTNPIQIGLGSVLGAIQRNFTSGSIETTGVSTDLAIEGNGFFVLNTSGGQQVYTRDGSFLLNANNLLVSADGFRVQGYGVDGDFNLIPGQVQDLLIPQGSLSLAQKTDEVVLNGTLDAEGDVGVSGAVWLSQVLSNGAAGPNATAATALTNLYDGATQLFAAGSETITVAGVEKGDRELESASFTIGVDGTTLGDFCNWLDDVLGIENDATVPGSPGITVVGGQIRFEGNYGEDNDLVIRDAQIRTDGAVVQPFTIARDAAATKGGQASGTSVRTNFAIYDSLGSSVDVMVTMVLETRSSDGNIWRFYIESPDDSDLDLAVGTGTVTFDTNGHVTSYTGTQIAIDRDDTGAATPLAFDLNVESLNGQAATLGDSSLAMTSQDGFPAGTLEAFSIGDNGLIVGIFGNGLTRTLGQLALANFSNPTGLVARTNSLFITGPNSGDPVITAPKQLGAGRILAGALELSNVDLSREFIGLITASTGFSAASRVITTSDELLQELLLLTR